ncbi:MAG: 1-acyl-sn-glycerol-3-phosphate acyltransferase [Candidatus Krumholzibacteriota bacterium]|nr:1-acyl-sn-glycerol-3-phosphate acyltransferase [Candidatus Krumholzibacteriota bacterium]
MLNRILQIIIHSVIIRSLVYVVFGLCVRNREKLPRKGPAIVVANHNSHIDTGVLMSLFPIGSLHRVHPVAAADYFLRSKFVAWFTLSIMGIIPIDRSARERGEDPFVQVSQALEDGEILIIFPEGTRGMPEQMVELKKGISHLIERHPDVPVTPVFLHGLGKALPKGSWLPVPFFVDVVVGDPVYWRGDRDRFMEQLRDAIAELGRTLRVNAE